MTVPDQHPTFEDLELLVEVSQLLTLQDLNTVMERVIALTASAVGAGKSSLFLLDGVRVDWDYIFTARALNATESIRVVSKVLDQGLAGWVVRNKEAALVLDTKTDDRWHTFPDDTRLVRSALCVPFLYNDQVVAVLTLDHPEPNHFTAYQLRLMKIITNQATVAIRNAQLFRGLHEKQRQLEAVLRSVPDVLMVTDSDGEVIMVNQGALDVLGFSTPDEAIGKPFVDYGTRSDVIRIILSAFEEQEIGSGLSLDVRSEKTGSDYAVVITTWDEQNSRSGGYVIAMHNVTTLKDLFRFKDEMLRIASHDLRSPLATIAGYTDMLDLDTPPDSPLRIYTHGIHLSVDRMSMLLEDLLKVRQIDEKGLNLEPNTLLMDIVLPVLQGAQLSAQQKTQTVQYHSTLTADDTGTVDPVLLRQAMENFASNAVKYTPEGGIITLRAFVKDGCFNFEVEDNGIGIPPESLPHVFESFYRVNANANVSVTGAGLGLSLVKSIVERHQGEVWVHSEEGKGSTFGMWVPI